MSDLVAFRLSDKSSYVIKVENDNYLIKTPGSMWCGDFSSYGEYVNFGIDVFIPEGFIGQLIINPKHPSAKNITFSKTTMIRENKWKSLRCRLSLTDKDYSHLIKFDELVMLTVTKIDSDSDSY